jgi:hypothetical protein
VTHSQTAIMDQLSLRGFDFIGRWSSADEKRLLESIAPLEALDEALWK